MKKLKPGDIIIEEGYFYNQEEHVKKFRKNRIKNIANKKK